MTDIPHGLVTGKVLHKTEWTDQLFSLQVSAPVSPYQAGQFTKLGLLNSEGEFVRRAYSMVNAPEHEQGYQHLEFLIIKDQSGQLSPQLHKLKVGSTCCTMLPLLCPVASSLPTINNLNA